MPKKSHLIGWFFSFSDSVRSNKPVMALSVGKFTFLARNATTPIVLKMPYTPFIKNIHTYIIIINLIKN